MCSQGAYIMKDEMDSREEMIQKDFEKFDLYERFVISDLVKRGYSIEKAVELVINQVEGDYSQLSDVIKKYVKE